MSKKNQNQCRPISFTSLKGPGGAFAASFFGAGKDKSGGKGDSSGDGAKGGFNFSFGGGDMFGKKSGGSGGGFGGFGF